MSAGAVVLKLRDGRMPVPCASCGETVGYLATEAVKRGARLAGHGLVPVGPVLRGVLDLAAFRCPSCERAGA